MTLTNGQLPLYACGGSQQNLSGPIAFGMFTNIATNNAADGVYTLNGTPCAIGDIIDLASEWTDFDPVADIDAGGIKVFVDGPSVFGRTMAMTGPLLISITDGFTVVYEFFCSADTVVDITAMSDDEVEYAYQHASFRVEPARDIIGLGDLTQAEEAEDATAGIAQSQINKIAFTVTDEKISASLNGGAVLPLPFAGISVNTSIVYIGMGGDVDARLRSFAFYEVVDDADLPTLSAL